MNKKILVSGSLILAVLFIVIAFIYWFTPAGLLPHFFPGFIAGSSLIHIKHGVGAFIIGLELLVYAWFTSGSKRSIS